MCVFATAGSPYCIFNVFCATRPDRPTVTLMSHLMSHLEIRIMSPLNWNNATNRLISNFN